VPDTTQRAWLLLGRLVSGTGKYKGITGENTFTGTVKSQTTVTSVRLTGTQTD
jgi:hypothetical protein